MKRIYLDNSATTPVDAEVLKAMLPYFSEKFGNASSVHFFGQDTRSAIDKSRHQIANFLNSKSTEIIFTSGGSESDNLAIRGLVESFNSQEPRNNNQINPKSRILNHMPPHVITSAFEHHAVLDTIKELESEGKIEVTYVKPNQNGLIEPADIESVVKENTLLVSIMYVNNEIGTVLPIRAIGQAIEKINRSRRSEVGGRKKDSLALKHQASSLPRIFFHTDAVQAAEYFDMNVDTLHVDLLTMSAHKIYGPKGIGLLYIRTGVPIKHQIVGGGQEYKKRAGTENVAGIVGFAKAVALIDHRKNDKIKKLRDRLTDGLLNIPDSFLNGDRENRSPANANISFVNAEGESILLNLDMEGIAASTGSACTSGSLQPSHVLISMGLEPFQCHGSIRFTLGRDTTELEINKVLEVMPAIIDKLRKMSPLK
jgi:cysteine desulfurase